MASITFQDGTTILTAWLNDVNGVVWSLFGGATTASAGRTALGLGDMATQTSSAVSITGGSVTLLTSFSSNSIASLGGITAATTIAATGNLSTNALLDLSNAAAGQIKFPASQNASANVNTLDDYEEGSWTPVVAFGGASVGITYTTQSGTYIKIGKQVFVTFAIQLSSKGSSVGSLTIQGLPFASANITNGFIGPVNWSNMTSSYVTLQCRTNNGTISDILGATAAATGVTAVVDTGCSNTSILGGSLTYVATA